MHTLRTAVCLLMPLLAGCTSKGYPVTDTGGGDSGAAGRCGAGALAAGEVRVLSSALDVDGTAGSEGIVFSPEGRLFIGGAAISGGGFVGELDAAGAFSSIADVPGSVGLEWWDGEVAVAVGSGGAAGELGGVVMVDPDSGATRVLSAEVPGANFPVLTPWGSLLVSSPDAGAVFEVQADGTTTTWVDGLVSPNGLVFGAGGDVLYVAQTYQTPSVFRAVAVDGSGAAGAITELATLDDGATQDGVAIDEDGDVYVVLNLPGQIVRITPAGETTLVAEGVDFGASMRFGRGDFSACSLFVSSLFSADVFEVGVGRPGGD
jgi:hypothetical protein